MPDLKENIELKRLLFSATIGKAMKLQIAQTQCKWMVELKFQKQSVELYCKKGVVKNVAKFTRKLLC